MLEFLSNYYNKNFFTQLLPYVRKFELYLELEEQIVM